MQLQNNIKQKLSATDSIQIIRDMIHDHPSSSRSEISRLVCEHFDFHNAKGKPQQSGCLKALRELEKPEHFKLPESRSVSHNKLLPKRLEEAVPLPVEVPSKAGDIIGLQLVQQQISANHKNQEITRIRKIIATKHDCVRQDGSTVETRYIKRAGAILRNQAHNGHKVSF